ncbi:unnamed protein product [Spirodela intermedia]|uniref:Uncharacterized protein n=1 Tax=Spirodela intermedia TaxID=51605 RepID=A0A7I8JMV0_SPIIN|nr:unnamed protein product [Spirodela intermedia]CAA6671476.1 unnamed protein product [Spirodela intermedia]
MADGGGGGKQLSDLPEVILHSIFTAVEETRTRNAMALVCRRWLEVDRATRSSLALRGNVRDLLLVPTCFQSVTHLDLSLLSPWGSSLLPVYHQHEDEDDELRHYGNQLIAHRLRQAFPAVTSLTVYARIPAVVAALGPQWPRLREVKLIRWHQRPNSEVGTELVPLLQHCSSLFSVDLSNFYCWTEDLPPALRACPRAAASLIRLDLLGLSSDQGFNSRELLAISAACPNLRHLRASCVFNPRLIGFVGEEALLGLAANCPRLSLLHLVDTSALSSSRAGGEENGGVPPEDSRISHRALEELFAGLPLLEDLALEVYPGVCDAGPVLETLNSRCPRMEALRLGQFQGICRATGLHLDGIAVCGRLRRLAVKNAGDLTDAGLVAIGRGCSRLAELEIEGCQEVTEAGIRRLVSNRRGTLVEVRIAGCRRLTAARSLWSVEPIRDRVESLHSTACGTPPPRDRRPRRQILRRKKKNSRPISNTDSPARRRKEGRVGSGAGRGAGSGGCHCGCRGGGAGPTCGGGVGELPAAGGDLHQGGRRLPEVCEAEPGRFFGLDSLSRYTRLRKMKLDCGEAQGCFIHGTAHEHFMNFLLKLPTIRDVQLREDYYPAPEGDASTEMRVDSTSRFEAALNRRIIPD